MRVKFEESDSSVSDEDGSGNVNNFGSCGVMKSPELRSSAPMLRSLTEQAATEASYSRQSQMALISRSFEVNMRPLAALEAI